MFREDAEESLFRFIERVADEPRWRERVRRCVRLLLRLSISERRWLGRDRLFQQCVRTAEHWGRFRGPRLALALGVDPSDPRSLGRIQDWEDALFGVVGHWVEEAPRDGVHAATKHETVCPFADLAAEDTRICTELVHRLETATFSGVAPGYRLLPLERLLSRGAPACEFRHEIRALDGVDATGAGRGRA